MRALLVPALVLALAPLPAPAQEGDDKSFLAGLLEGALSDTGRDVTIEGFAGALSSTATIDKLTIADSGGIWLVLEGAEMQWNRAALLQGRIEIGAISAQRVTLSRLPVLPPSEGLTPEAKGFALPVLPVAIDLGALSIGDLTLGAPVLGQEVHLAAQGRASLEGGAGDTRLTVVRIDGQDGFVRIDGAFDNETKVLDLTLALNEGAGGIAAKALGLPGEPPLGLNVAGHGPLDGFAADLSLATNGQERLGGHLTTLPADNGAAMQIALGGDLTVLLPADIAQVIGHDARLTASAHFGGGVVDLQDLSLRADALTVTGAARIGGQSGLATEARLHVETPDLGLFASLAGMDLGGAGQFDLSLRADPMAGLFDATIDGVAQDARSGIAVLDPLLAGEARLHIAGRRGVEGMTLDALDVTTQAARINATAVLNSLGLTTTFDTTLNEPEKLVAGLIGPLQASGQATRLDGGEWLVNADAKGPGGIYAEIVGSLFENGEADAGLKGRLPLALVALASRAVQMGGEAVFDMALKGPLGIDALSGRMTVENARVALPSLGQSVEALGGTVDVAAGAAQLALQGRAAGGGDLTLGGRVTLMAPFGASLGLDLDRLALADPALYRTTASGRVTLEGPLTGAAHIAGELTLGETEIRVPTESIGTAALPDVAHQGASAAVAATLDRAGLGPHTATTGGGPAYTIDLGLSAPDRIFVRGRGVDAEMGGGVRLGGSLDALRPEGQFNLIRGRLDLLDQRFVLTEGALRLEGRFLPSIRLVAQTTARTGTEVTVALDGPATEPVVTLTSNPSLPEDEILSQLILGRNLSEIGPLQAVQLASAAATLAGRGGVGIVDKIRSRFGLDDLDVVTDGNGGTAVRAGKYIGENIYSDVTVGTDGSAEVSLNLDLGGPYTARGTATTTGATSLGIFYEKDY